MVTHVSALGRNGLHDWLLLRVSAVVIALYLFYIFGFVAITSEINYIVWRGFFAATFTKVFTLLTLLAILVHSWIGMWQVFTDYIKCATLRLILQLAVVAVSVIYLLYGTIVMWGV